MRIRSAFAVAAGAALMGLLGTALPADATGYRYWSYYHQSADGWEYSQVRMDSHVPDDGAVEGWRFVTAELGDQTRTPRVQNITFGDVCGGVTADDGQKRVALVIDYGRAADAPGGGEPPDVGVECAVVDQDATTAMALSSVAELRRDDERLCGIDGHPASGCNEAVDPLPDAAAKPDDEIAVALAPDSGDNDTPNGAEAATDDGPSGATWAGMGVALVVVLGAAAAIRRRRSRG